MNSALSTVFFFKKNLIKKKTHEMQNVQNVDMIQTNNKWLS